MAKRKKKNDSPLNKSSAVATPDAEGAAVATLEPPKEPKPKKEEVAIPPRGVGRGRRSMIHPDRVDGAKTYVVIRSSPIKRQFQHQLMVTADEMYARGINPTKCVELGWARPVDKDVADRAMAVLRGEDPGESESSGESETPGEGEGPGERDE